MNDGRAICGGWSSEIRGRNRLACWRTSCERTKYVIFGNMGKILVLIRGKGVELLNQIFFGNVHVYKYIQKDSVVIVMTHAEKHWDSSSIITFLSVVVIHSLLQHPQGITVRTNHANKYEEESD